KHLTVVTYSKAVETSLEAAKELSGVGIELEVINLRTLRPLDEQTIVQSVAKTNHLVTVEQGWPHCGIGSEICARIVESETFYHLDSSPMRITAVDIPMPYANSLEVATLPQASDIIHTVKKILGLFDHIHTKYIVVISTKTELRQPTVSPLVFLRKLS
ncbi:unnamed protein product, partial [Timema podura]|nr:unnamed protein product [Timema podura]